MEHGKLYIESEVSPHDAYSTHAERRMAERYGLRVFEASGTCKDCHERISCRMACSKCDLHQLCESHAKARYPCGKCAH